MNTEILEKKRQFCYYYLVPSHELYSIRVHAGSRTYFFDVKLSQEGTFYLKISESRAFKDVESENQAPSGLMIFAENGHLEEFRAALGECAAFIRGAQSQEIEATCDGLSEVKRKYPQAYAPWTPDLDVELWRRYCDCETTKTLAAHFGRQESAIRSRLEKLKLKNASQELE